MNGSGNAGAPVSTSPRILLISQPTGAGTGRHVADLAEGLMRDGFDVTVACPPEGMLPARLKAASVRVVDLPMRREIGPIADVRAFIGVYRLCRRLRPDILHAHSSKAGFLGRIAGRLAGVPVVVFTPHCWSFQSAQGRKRAFYLALERFASRFCDVTVTVSEQEAAEARDERVVAPERLRVIHNGVSSAEFDAGVPGVRDIAFVSVGRLDEQKGYSYLLQAMAQLVAVEPGARLCIIGDGTLRAELEEEAAHLGLGDVVEFAGEQADVGSFLRRSHVFVLASLWEGLPYTIIEAMAARLPVVCTDVGGCRELVSNGETGLLVPPRDSSALASAMRALWRDDPLRSSMGSAGFERARREFRLEDTIARNESVYRDGLAVAAREAAEVRPDTLFGRRGAALLVTFMLVAAAWAAADLVTFRDKIMPGVVVGGARVGGMTLDEARRTTQRLLDRPIEVSVTPTSTKVPMSGRDAGVDLVRGLERAYLVGRTGALPTRISERIAASQGRVVVALPARDSGVVAELLADARSRQEREPVNAEFEVRSGQLQVVPGIPGTRVDECAFLEVLGEAATSARASQRVAVATTVRVRAPITSADLGRVASTAQEWTSRDIVGVAPGVRLALSREDVASLLTVRDGELAVAGERVAGALSRLSVPVSAPRNARFVVVNGRVTVVDGAPGTQVDASATALALEGALKSGSDRFEIALSRREPDIARADLEAMGITRQLSSFTTHFRLGQDGRDVNINLAASAIRGTVVNIGGVFSLNAVTGPRNKGTGYKEALVFSHGKVVPGIGGGVCQVSSTTYQAALRAGLRIVERRSHSMAVSYLAPGLDATTYYPTVDLKFQNTTRGPILMWTEVRGNALIVSVYGSGARPTVQIKTVMRKTMQPRKRVVYVTSLPHNRQVVEEVGRPGYVVTSYRLVYQSGRVVRREELATDEYQPRDWIIRVGI